MAAATRRDRLLSKLFHCCKQGWPVPTTEDLIAYEKRREELTTEGDGVMQGLRVVVPQKLRTRVLQELHSGHPAKLCTPCQSQRKNHPKAPLATWPWPTTPWERVHVDYLGPFLGKMILVAIDAHSKWPEAKIMSSTTAAQQSLR